MERKHKLYGFPEVFMVKIAEGYIGTTAKVNSKCAAKMAKKLLSHAHQPEGIQIAERLKLIRREVVQQLSTEPQINRYFTAKICLASRRNETANCRFA